MIKNVLRAVTWELYMQNHNATHAILDFKITTLDKSKRYISELQLIVLAFNILNNNDTRLN